VKLLWCVQRYGPTVLGGSEYATRQFARRMVERGHNVTVLTSRAESYSDWANVFPEGESEDEGVKVIRLSVTKPRQLEPFQRLHELVTRGSRMPLHLQNRWAQEIGPLLVGYREWIRDNSSSFDAAIFKAYLYYTATAGIRSAKGRVPVIFNPEAHPEQILNLPLFDSVFRFPDAFQFQTPEEEDLVCSRFGIRPQSKLVGIGIDEVQTDRLSLGVLHRFHLQPQSYVIAVGRTGEGKGVPDLLHKFRKYKVSTSSSLKLVLVGDNSAVPNFDSDVISTGYLSESDKNALIHHALCLIQASYYESFSIVLTEAWNLSAPVLVRSSSAVLRGQTTRSKGGLFFDSDEEFERNLGLLLDNPALRNDLGASGYEFVRANYRWDSVLDRFESLVDVAVNAFSSKKRSKYRFDLH
jgi:glycosyltransferase involved in cell wall biosynthesis